MSSLLDFFQEDFQLSILDIGASLSEAPPYQSLVDAGRARIIGFEPVEDECERLNQEYGPPHRFFPYFIGDGKPAIFHETNWVQTGSLFEPNLPLVEKFTNLAELMQPLAKHPVNTTRLDDIAEIDDVDFIKIDTQGAELSIFQNASRALASTLFIQTEVEFLELYKGQPMFADVDTFLRNNGFQFHTINSTGMRTFKPMIYSDPSEGLRQQLWADAVYVRDWMNLDVLSETKLRKYAVLAHDIFQSWDLAYLLLMTLDKRTGENLAAAYADFLRNSG